MVGLGGGPNLPWLGRYYYPKIRKSHLMLIHLRYHAHILLKKKVINDFIHSEERQRVLH